MPRAWLVLVLVWTMSGCESATSIDVRVLSADLATVPDHVRLEVYTASGTSLTALNAPDPRRDLAPDETVRLLLDAPDDPTNIIVLVDGYMGSALVGSGQATGTLQPEQRLSVTVDLGAAALCGDGTVRRPREECDDNNRDAGDGCSTQCHIERPPDAGPGRDAGASDGGGTDPDGGGSDPDGGDAGHTDGGPRADGGIPDGGNDAGSPSDGGSNDAGEPEPGAPTLLAHWPLDGDLVDAVSGQMATSTVDAPTFIVGPSGRALYSGETGEAVNAAPIATLSTETAFTMAAWIRRDDETGSGGLIMALRDGADSVVRFSFSEDALRWTVIGTDDTGVMEVPEYGVHAPAGTWHHVAAVFDGTAEPDLARGRLYIDGVATLAVTEVPMPPATVDLSTTTVRFPGLSPSLSGAIDDVRFYRGALAEGAVQALAQGGTPPVPTDFAHYWPLEGDALDVVTQVNAIENGTLTYGPAVAARGLTLVENGSHIGVGPLPLLAEPSAITVALWWNMHPDSPVNRYMWDVRSNNTNDFSAWVTADTMQWDIGNGSDSELIISNWYTYAPKGQWHHITWRFDGTAAPNERAAIFVDGTRVVGADVEANDIPSNVAAIADEEMTFGRTSASGAHGQFDEIYIYDRALSDGEVSQLVAAGQ